MPEFKGPPTFKLKQEILKTPEVSAEFLRNLFASEEFKSTFRKTLDLVGRSAREWGFSVFKALRSNEVLYSKPIGGASEDATEIGVAESEVIKKIRKEKKLRNQKFFNLLNLHFHNVSPVENDAIIPSPEDLETMNFTRMDSSNDTDFDIPQIGIIALRTSPETSNLLLLQENLDHPIQPERIFEDIGDSMTELVNNHDSQEEVIRVLNFYGYKTAFITNFSGDLTKENLNLLESFAFKPKAVLEEDTLP